MAFVCTLGDDVSVAGLVRDGEHLLRAQIGYDEEEGFVASLLVTFVERIAYPPTHRELMFFVVRAWDSGELEELNDGRSTEGFLDPGVRARCVRLISQMASLLASEVEPKVIVMATVTPYLPNEALTKYERIVDALTDGPYRGGQVDPFRGSRMWVLERC